MDLDLEARHHELVELVGSRSAIVILALSLGPTPAFAYVRTTSSHSGLAVAWLESCVTVQPDSRGSADVPMAQILDTLTRAAANWTGKTGGCGQLQVYVVPPTGAFDVAPDGRQVVVFRQDRWARPGGMPHDPGAIGLTTVFYVDSPGALGDASILDADIELNGVNYTFITTPVAAARPGTRVADLENTLTHELGHVQGLAHNCWDHTTPSQPVDNTGTPAPECFGPLPASIPAATMFPFVSVDGETSKRNLSPDDVLGICDVYRHAAMSPACYNQVAGGCALLPPGPGPGGWLGALLLGAALLCRRWLRGWRAHS